MCAFTFPNSFSIHAFAHIIMSRPAYTPEFLQMVSRARLTVRGISISHLAALPAAEQPLLIDVREDHEWQAGHVEGAVHLSRGIIEQHIHEHATDFDAWIVCYCHAGNRGVLVVESLQKLGYTNVAYLEGGFSAWQNAGLTITRTRLNRAALFPLGQIEQPNHTL
jgi:rhodanese-related sulfurtransferase